MNAVSEVAAICELITRPAGLSAIAVIGVKSLPMSNDAVLFWMRSMVCASEMTTPMVVPSGADALEHVHADRAGGARLIFNYHALGQAFA